VKINTGLSHNYYGWGDDDYREFMRLILSGLEPRQEEINNILFHELDEFTEILFINSGMVDIGFEINRKKVYCIRKNNMVIIGDHGCTFNHQSYSIFKTKTVCKGFSIRKHKWLKILNTTSQVLVNQLKSRIITSYFYGTKLRMIREKKKYIKKISLRADIQSILAVSDKDQSRDMNFLLDNFPTHESVCLSKAFNKIEERLKDYTNEI